MKYETEVKKETKKATKTMAAGLMPSNVAQQQRKASQTAEASKKAAAAAAKKSQTVQQGTFIAFFHLRRPIVCFVFIHKL